MKISENIELKNYTTMRISARAKYLIEIFSRKDLLEAVDFAEAKKLPWFVLGGGSNLIANGNFDGVIFLNKIREFSDLGANKYRLGAGEIADEIIANFCEKNLSGMECLSLIPEQSAPCRCKMLARTVKKFRTFLSRQQFLIFAKKLLKF